MAVLIAIPTMGIKKANCATARPAKTDDKEIKIDFAYSLLILIPKFAANAVIIPI